MYAEDQSKLRFFVQGPVPGLSSRPAWCGSTAFVLLVEDSSHRRTNGRLLLLQSVNVAIRSNCVPFVSGMLITFPKVIVKC